ncbi:MAG TPA: NAD(P)/FAD-dependent oxidoreductase [Terracidiphilus sp.]|jgi:phytoene dehydrogenase-like protein
MKQNGRKIAIVGGGIAGLCTAVYALKCGYQVEVLEMHDMAGGLAMSWRRGAYTFETCLHWLVGSKPGGDLHAQWSEVFDIDRLTFVNEDEFVRVETDGGDAFSVYANVDRLEHEMLRRAPQDSVAILELTRTIRTLGKFRFIDPSSGIRENWLNILRDLPILPLFAKLLRISGKEYAKRFSDPLIAAFFGRGDMGRMSVIAILLSLAWMNKGNAGYCHGGALAMIRRIEAEVYRLGGEIAFGARVNRIVVENDTATGVMLADGRMVNVDWVISAADGHATIFDMLGGRYLDRATKERYEQRETFPSYLQVSLGIALDLSDEPPMATRLLYQPLVVDPVTELDALSFRIFNFDPTFAPKGKTVVTSFVPTRNFDYWKELRQSDPGKYRSEKRRVAEAVIDVLEKRIPYVRSAIEVCDVSTPASVHRYTGNWKGSMEGWFISPGSSLRPLPNTLEGLRQFAMVGQWVSPGGGLPSGLMSARNTLKSICRHDHVTFAPEPVKAEKAEAVPV